MSRESLVEPGYGRILAAASVHGVASGCGRPVLVRTMAVASLVASVGVVLLATALPATWRARHPGGRLATRGLRHEDGRRISGVPVWSGAPARRISPA